MAEARVMAGIPEINQSFYHLLRFSVGDPAAWVQVGQGDDAESTLILRDIEMGRARQHARADAVACPADFTPAEGLSGDRETATAQAVAELLRRRGVKCVTTDRALPFIYAHLIQQAGIRLDYDDQWGVAERRAKDADEVEQLREAQAMTELVMEMACRRVAHATEDAEGVLHQDGEPLTSDRLRSEIDVFLMQRNYSNPSSIVACGPQGADCHERGSGPLRTGQPVIIDIFPCNRKTRYNGDCTRTVVHGTMTISSKSMPILTPWSPSTPMTRSRQPPTRTMRPIGSSPSNSSRAALAPSTATGAPRNISSDGRNSPRAMSRRRASLYSGVVPTTATCRRRSR